MSEPGKAVFLSYASQDAEAAKRIADALRAAGVEVWFDAEGGLEHGDEWDRKIRRQIKECVLFIPLISAHTQEREEGYFRIEWDLAAERARGIASGVAFILPVVVDDTKEPGALVPDRFRAVQWTKLLGGNVPPEVLQRFLKLWSHRTGTLKQAAAGVGADGSGGSEAPRGVGRPRPAWPWLALGVLALGVAYLIFKPRRSPEEVAKIVVDAQKPAAAVAPQTEAQKLVARMQEIYDKGDDSSNDEWTLAEELGERATKLEPVNAEAWAAYSNVVSMPYIFGFDYSPERLARATKAAERAMTLDSGSVAARLALANCRRLQGPLTTAEADTIIRQLLVAEPDNWQVLRMAGNIFRTEEKFGEAIAYYDRAATVSGNRPFVLHGKARTLMGMRRFADAEAILDQLLTRNASPAAAVRKIGFQLYVHDDLDAAEAMLAQVSPAFLSREEGAEYASTLWLWRRNADQCVAALARFGGDTIHGVPKGMVSGSVYRAVQRESAARVEWQAALQKIEQALAASPNNPDKLYWKAALVALLGRMPEAEKLLETCEQLHPLGNYKKGSLLLLLGRTDEALGLLEAAAAEPLRPLIGGVFQLGNLRHDPAFDAIRSQPRFQAMLVKLEAMTPMLQRAALRAPAATDKSVAVLPFANLSGDPAQEYFSDGLTDEILTALSTERDLRVVARTSAFAFKGKSMSLAEIARALNVAQVVEGSVRKSGNTVKITVSLTRASDGFSEPLGTFTEKLDDIFALQEKVARAVVEKLTKRTVTVEGVVVLTKNPEAYDLYLKARAERRNPAIGSRLTLNSRDASIYQRERLLQAAVTLDPSFAAGWAELASTQSELYNNNVDRSAERLALMKASVDHAVRLAPEMPEVLSALGRYHLISANDYPRAAEQFEKRIRLQPNNAEAYYELGVVQRRQGRWAAARANFEKTSQLDPGNPGALRSGIIRLLENGRRYEEAAQWQRRLVALQPDNVVEGYNLAKLAFKARGSTREVEDYLTGLKDTPQVLALRQNWMALQGNYAEAIRLGRQLNSDGTKPTAPAALQLALLLSATGDVPGARALLAGYPAELRTSLEREPANSTILRQLAFIEAVLGHRDEALRAARQGMELLPESLNPWDGASRRATLAFVLAWTGDRDGALTEYAKLLRMLAADSGEQNVREMRHHPLYFPLQGDRRFEALLNDPKNDEPLL